MNCFYRFTFVVIHKCGVFFNFANKDIFCWVPSHTGIRGNEKADSAAKSALDLPRVKVGVSYDDWNGAVANKLHYVKPVLGDWQTSCRWCRKDEVDCVVPASVIHI